MVSGTGITGGGSGYDAILAHAGGALWTLECVFRGNVGIHRAPKVIQVDGSRPRRMTEVSLSLSYPEPLQVTGPLPSLVLWAEDMW